MKKWFLISLSAALMFAAVGCAGGEKPENKPAANQDQTEDKESVSAPETSVDDDAAEGSQDGAVDENAPEYITVDSIGDTVSVPLYCSFFIDSKAVDFKCGEVKIPSQLEVDEAQELHPQDDGDDQAEDLTVKDYFQNTQKQYGYVEAEGTLPATRSATDHKLIVSARSGNEEYTLEALTAENKDWIVKEAVIDGVSGFVLYPDTQKHDSGFATVLIYMNAGAYEHAYGTGYCCMEVRYQGGMVDFAEVDFEEITDTLLELITVDLKQVK